MIFTEKYRPATFDTVVGLDPNIPKLVGKDQPHFLFFGRAGTGKTTTAKIIIKVLESDALILNASDERGIDTIRDKVKQFVSTKSTNEKIKIVFLDEADALTKDAQTSLRNMMEQYAGNSRFILSCNFINKIIEPIQSRCARFEFKQNNDASILVRLKKIVEEENIKITESALTKIVSSYKPDIRKMICSLQELKCLDRLIEAKDVEVEQEFVKEIVKSIMNKDLLTARQIALDSLRDYDDILVGLYWEFRKQNPLPLKVLLMIGDAMRDLKDVISKEIGFECLLLRLTEYYEGKK